MCSHTFCLSRGTSSVKPLLGVGITFTIPACSNPFTCTVNVVYTCIYVHYFLIAFYAIYLTFLHVRNALQWTDQTHDNTTSMFSTATAARVIARASQCSPSP